MADTHPVGPAGNVSRRWDRSRPCACGCGEFLPRKARPDRKYFENACRKRAWKARGGVNVMSLKAERLTDRVAELTGKLRRLGLTVPEWESEERWLNRMIDLRRGG